MPRVLTLEQRKKRIRQFLEAYAADGKDVCIDGKTFSALEVLQWPAENLEKLELQITGLR
jgi:hypothetical protein